jgi:hypothetical protein
MYSALNIVENKVISLFSQMPESASEWFSEEEDSGSDNGKENEKGKPQETIITNPGQQKKKTGSK